jgi:adenosylhomocysteine nucleosidase
VTAAGFPTAIVSPLAAELAAVAAAATGLRRLRLGGPWAASGWLGGRPVLLATTGDGARSAARGLEALLAAARPERLLFLGVAGGISPGLAIGELVVAQRLFSWRDGAPPDPVKGPVAELDAGDACSGAGELQEVAAPAAPDAEWLAQAVASGGGPAAAGEVGRVGGSDSGSRITAGVAITCDRILVEAEEKAALYRRFGRLAPAPADGQPVVCDLESAVYARLAAANGVPFLMVRAALDLADEDLPIDFNLCRGADGEVSNARVVTRILAHGSGFAALLRLRARMRLCSRRLAAVAMELAGAAAAPPPGPAGAGWTAGRAGG